MTDCSGSAQPIAIKYGIVSPEAPGSGVQNSFGTVELSSSGEGLLTESHSPVSERTMPSFHGTHLDTIEGKTYDSMKSDLGEPEGKGLPLQSPSNGKVTKTALEDGKDDASRRNSEESHLDIANYDTSKLLKMLTALLNKIVKSNDELSRNKEPAKNIHTIMSFRGKQVPQISLGQYFERIQKYCPTTNDVFLSLLVYFDRVFKNCNNCDGETFVMDSYSIHRLIIAGVTVCTKFLSDFFYSNSRYARVGGISLQELNSLELQFLFLCDLKLLVPVSDLQRYADLLLRFWETSEENPDNQT